MFWGLHVKSTPKSNDATEYIVEKTIKISQAVLVPPTTKALTKKSRNSSIHQNGNPGTPNNQQMNGHTPAAQIVPQGPLSLVLEHDNKKFVLCTLDPTKSWQCPLDLFFPIGSMLKLSLQGGYGIVHLSGYQVPEDSTDDEIDDADDDDDEDSDSDEVEKFKNNAKKGKAGKRAASRKARNAWGDADDEEDEDDEDFDAQLVRGVDSSDDEDDDDEDDDEMDGMDDDDDDEDEEEEE